MVGSLGGDKIETAIYSVTTEKLHRQLYASGPRSPTSARFTASNPELGSVIRRPTLRGRAGAVAQSACRASRDPEELTRLH
jgi:hypothetical protein